MAFMVPVTEYMNSDEAREIQEACIEDGGDPGELEAGWYSRLSAPGYMDCTEWTGPFKTGDEALAYCMEMYEVDEDGEDDSGQ